MPETKYPKHRYHRFLDEAGDLTFYGKSRVPSIGNEGVSRYFILGMLTLNTHIETVRQNIIDLQTLIAGDPYFQFVPSIQKRKENTCFFLHAKDDVPEVRKMAFELIKDIDCHFEAVIGRKDYGIYEKKHNGDQSEFYADLFSHLLIDNLNGPERLVLNIAHRSKCTTHKNLEKGLEKATIIANNKYSGNGNWCKVDFNIQYPTTEPIINLVDYLLWALQRKMEKNEDRYLKFIEEKYSSITTLYSNDEA